MNTQTQEVTGAVTTANALKMAIETLENNKQTHYYCQDTFYSCPKHEDGCSNDFAGTECECGADETNAEFDKAIQACKEALAQPAQEPYGWEYAGAIWNDKDEVFGWHKKHKLEQNPPLPLYTHPAPQPAQEPVALHTSSNPFNSERHGLEVLRNAHPAPEVALAPDATQWHSLSDDVVMQTYLFIFNDDESEPDEQVIQFYKLIEQELKRKNHFNGEKNDS